MAWGHHIGHHRYRTFILTLKILWRWHQSQECESMTLLTYWFSWFPSSACLVAQLCPTLCQACLSITNSQSLLQLMSIKSVMPSNHFILRCPFLLLPSIFSNIRVFSRESVLPIRWPKYCSFSINPYNEYSGLISFRMDWLDLLAVQGTLKTLLQHHSSKASSFI